MTDENKIQWMGHEWLTHESWGRCHPEKPYQWYDDSCVSVNDGVLELQTKYNPKLFTLNGDKIVSETAIGLVSCLYPFHFGEYEIEAMLPQGAYLWPAIWLWSLTGWPPEIDIVEAYSNHKGSYFDWALFPYKVKRNGFYRSGGNVDQIGAKNIWVGLKPPQKRFVKYQMIWTPDYIKIGANGCFSRKINGDLMKHYQEPMRFVINNAVQRSYRVGSLPSIFKIKSFKYNKLNS